MPSDLWRCLSLAVIVAALFLIAGIDGSGLWDPHELDRAELARRIAIHVFGAENLVVAGDENSLPTLSDLRGGELGFTAMAAGFRVWGLHPFAGRLPLAFFCLAGVLAAFGFVARTVSPRAALYTAVVLCTMPAFFLQARTMIGEAAVLAAFALCFFGLGGALLEERVGPAAVFALLGVVGAMTGFLSRGLILGVAAPLLGVGLSWLALVGGGVRAWRRLRPSAIGGLSLVGGAGAAWLGSRPLVEGGRHLSEVKRVLGVAVLPSPPLEATFDLAVRELGHGLFPWSALLPFALGLVLVPAPAGRAAPRGDAPRGEAPRRRAVRTLLVVGAATAYAAHVALAPFAGVTAFVGVTALAAVLGVAIEELDRRPPLPVVGVGTLLLLAVLVADLRGMPHKGLSAFAVPDAELPLGIAESLEPALLVATAWFAALALATFAAPEPGLPAPLAARVRARLARYETITRELGAIWGGNLAFGFLVLEAGLLGMGATILIGRRLGWPSVATMSRTWAYVGLNLWWFVPLGLCTLPLLVDVARRSAGWLFERTGTPRSGGILLAALGAGAVLSVGYYGAMAEQLSPKGALDAYASLRRPHEPLGLLGLNARMGRYYGGGDGTTLLSSPREAVRFLVDDAGTTRWLVFRQGRLAELNALFRDERSENLPMVDTGSGKIFLATSRPRETSNNPLEPFVRSRPPATLQHPLDARFGDALDVLGWEVVDDDGALVDAVEVGRSYRMRLHLAVRARLGRSWRAFLHVEAAGRRHNGDHDLLGGLYPTTFWRVGDHIVDEHRFALERHFPPGPYAVYFGYFIHRERMPVTRGRHHEDRLRGGVLEVR